MSTIYQQRALTPALAVFRSASLHTRTLLAGANFWLVVLGVLGLGVGLRICAPIGLGRATAGAQNIEDQLLALLIGSASLVVLLQADAWSWLYRAQGEREMAAIACLTSVYLHFIGAFCVFLSTHWLAPAQSEPHVTLALARSAWFASLVGLLALPRMERGARVMLFLLLGWGIPAVLAGPDPILALTITPPSGAPRGLPENLSMMIPHLLAFGYTRLQRARR